MCPISSTKPEHFDRRKTRTRRMLREALFTLMLEKGYEAVTIEDITTRADLGRTTFYLHYRDKEELLLESIETIAHELKDQIIEAVRGLPKIDVNAPSFQIPPHPAITILLKHAALNTRLYLPILHGEGTPRAPAHIRELIQQTSFEYFSERVSIHPENDPSVPLEVLINFFSSSLLGMLTWWLENDMIYPPEQMSEIYLKLFYNGASLLFTPKTLSPFVTEDQL